MSGFTISSLESRIAGLVDHSEGLSPESSVPIRHYHIGANGAYNSICYVDHHLSMSKGYENPRLRHLARLRCWAALFLIEAFERFLKELASVCVDQLVPLVLDDRISKLSVRTAAVVAHFDSQSLGRALTEGEVWLDVSSINERFRRLLGDPYVGGGFELLPRQDTSHGWRRGSLEILFQLRHSIVHNAGVLTQSDAARLRLLARREVNAPRSIAPTAGDLLVIKTFLDETTKWANSRVAERLAALLTVLHASNPNLFDPATKASEVASALDETVEVAGSRASP